MFCVAVVVVRVQYKKESISIFSFRLSYCCFHCPDPDRVHVAMDGWCVYLCHCCVSASVSLYYLCDKYWCLLVKYSTSLSNQRSYSRVLFVSWGLLYHCDSMASKSSNLFELQLLPVCFFFGIFSCKEMAICQQKRFYF